mgnify:CR=1 FL=1
MSVEKKIKELRLIPLFPDKNFNYTSFDLKDGGEVIEIIDLREESNLRFKISFCNVRICNNQANNHGQNSDLLKYVLLYIQE